MSVSFSFRLYSLIILLIINLLIDANCIAQSKETQVTQSAVVGSKNSGSITISELLDAGKVTLTDKYMNSFAVISFRLTIIQPGENPVELLNNTNGEFTPEMVQLLKKTNPGDKVYFEYIKCKATDGSTLSLAAISFVIR